MAVVGGGEQPATDKPLKIGNFTFQSRLITGTGKYSSYDLMRDCLAASGCEVTTVAVRRERLMDKQGKSILDFLDLNKLTKRIVSLPLDLVRNEGFMTQEPIPRAVIDEILDSIFLPLVIRKKRTGR